MPLCLQGFVVVDRVDAGAPVIGDPHRPGKTQLFQQGDVADIAAPGSGGDQPPFPGEEEQSSSSPFLYVRSGSAFPGVFSA